MLDTHRPVFSFLASIALALPACLPAPLTAQCTNPWPTTPGAAGVEGDVSAMLVFDPDGPGPLGERVLVSGTFAAAGKVLAQNLAVYDPLTHAWSAFGPGPYPTNLRLATTANGDVYVGGKFSSIAGVAATNVARWDGSNWSALGSGVDGPLSYKVVADIAVLAGGDIVVTGAITQAGGAAANGIARWDGSSWSSLGATSLPGSPTFDAVVGLPNGDICAAVWDSTTFPATGGVLRFDGSTWSPVGTLPWPASCLLASASGELFAGGGNGVARWNGTTWLILPGVPLVSVQDLAVLPNGLLAAAGYLGASSQQRVAVWDGIAWLTLGDSNYAPQNTGARLVTVGDEILTSGGFTSFDGVAAGRVARWNGLQWGATSPGFVASARWLTVRQNGEVFAATAVGMQGEGLVHRWTGFGWSTIGGGFYLGYSQGTRINTLQALPSGRLIAGGQEGSSTTPMPVVQQWSNPTWTTLATATWGRVHAAAELPNGDLVVGGQFVELSGTSATNVARFDGTAWSPLGAGIAQTVTAFAAAANGDLYALAGLSVFRWTGATWSQVGLSLSSAPKALVVGVDGMPVVGGDFAGANVQRWNGAVWNTIGGGPPAPVQSLVVLANGDLVAGPVVAGGIARTLQRWDGSAWTQLGGTIDGTVWSLAVALNGDLLLAGDFTIADGAVRPRFARVSTSCPASVVALPSNCYQSSTLTAHALPWIGGLCRTTATGLLYDQLAVTVTGAQGTALPLGPLFGLGSSSCTLLVVPILLDLSLPVAGAVQAQFAVPDSPAMIGTPLHQQVVSLALDATGSIVSARGSNSLVFLVGSF